MSVNKVILVGRLGRDPETRFTSGGQAVCNFTMATDETYKDRNGERQKRTEWHRIVLWGKLAEIAQQYLKKGHLIYIEGRIQSRQWDDQKTNTKRTSTDIVANVMRMLTSRAESMAAGARSYRHVDSILKHGLDRIAPAEESESKQLSLTHENVRGRDYYH